MTAMDWNLRDLLELAVGEPPRRVNLEAVRRRAIRRRTAQIGAVGLAAVLAAGLGAALSAGAVSTSRPAAHGGRPSGPPRYYLTQLFDQKTHQVVIAVRARAGGRVTAEIGSPRPGMNCGGGDAGFAPAGRRTFFMTCVIWRSALTGASRPGWLARQPGRTTFLETVIYRFRLTGSGRVTGLSPVKGGALKGVLGDNIAAAPDGSDVAVEVIRPGGPGGIPTNIVPAEILVINTSTGQRAHWRAGRYVPGALQFAGGRSLSLNQEGTELVVLEARCHRQGDLANCPGHDDVQVRAYAPAMRGGSLEYGQVLLQPSALRPAGASPAQAFISPDGATLTTVLVSCPKRGSCTLSEAQLAPGTNRVRRVLYRVHTGTAFQGVFERFASIDPTGRFLILDAGAGAKRVNGWIDHGQLVPLTPADGNDPIYEAW